MEFVERMKKREFIEMALKTAIAVFASLIAITLMEGMIYGIQLKALRNSSASMVTEQTVAYCIKEDDKYFVVYSNENSQWTASKDLLTKEQCEALKVGSVPVKEVIYRAPNAFEFSITPVHYVVMTVFVLVVIGYFVYRFIALGKEYKKIEENYKKTGTIELHV